jgi:hypothetical protein
MKRKLCASRIKSTPRLDLILFIERADIRI